MTRIHYWSDLHLGHNFVAKLRGFNETPPTGIFAAQPASTWHDTQVQEAWQEHVRPNDHIWILGDISGGRSEDYALEFISGLPGIKHLISGNHDSVASIHRNAWKQQAKFLEVFASVQDFARHKVQGVNFLLSHYPYTGDHGDRADRYAEYRLPDTGIPLVHGHIHDRWDQETTGKGTPMMNVGVDQWMRRPANTEDIIDWLNSEQATR